MRVASVSQEILFERLQVLLGERGDAGNRAVLLRELDQGPAFATTLSGGIASLANGLVTSPSLRFNASPATGIFSPAINQIGFSTAGVLALLLTSTAVSVGNGGGVPVLSIDGAAGGNRALEFSTGGVRRWRMIADNLAESGGNAGSRFQLNAFDDAGVFLRNIFLVDRATQVLNFDQAPTIAGATLAETIDDRVNALLVAGANITKTYDDVANTLTLSATGGGGGAYSPAQGWAF